MSGLFPFKIRRDENQNKELREYYTEFCHTHVRVGPKAYTLLDDYWYEAMSIYYMPLKSDDKFVVTFPQSGTTWIQELVWLVNNDLAYEKAADIPITLRYRFLEFQMFMSNSFREKISKNNTCSNQISVALDIYCAMGAERIARTPSPRFIKSHLPLSLLPQALLDTAKVVYVARDPRDVAVAYYHYTIAFQMAPYNSDFKTFWNLFTRGMVLWAPYFEHLKEAWKIRKHPNMLFLFYEDIIKDLPGTVQTVAAFFGKQYSDEQFEGLCRNLSFDNFEKSPCVDMDELKDLGLISHEESFTNKGRPGVWREYFDDEMSKEAEDWISDNLRDTEFSFPWI